MTTGFDAEWAIAPQSQKRERGVCRWALCAEAYFSGHSTLLKTADVPAPGSDIFPQRALSGFSTTSGHGFPAQSTWQTTDPAPARDLYAAELGHSAGLLKSQTLVLERALPDGRSRTAHFLGTGGSGSRPPGSGLSTWRCMGT